MKTILYRQGRVVNCILYMNIHILIKVLLTKNNLYITQRINMFNKN